LLLVPIPKIFGQLPREFQTGRRHEKMIHNNKYYDGKRPVNKIYKTSKPKTEFGARKKWARAINLKPIVGIFHQTAVAQTISQNPAQNPKRDQYIHKNPILHSK